MTQLTSTIEQSATVALLGAPGAYHDIACDYLSPQSTEAERVRCQNFEGILQALSDGEANTAIIAVANSEIGTLWDAYDEIAKHDAWATGEARVRIRHNLLGLAGVALEQITHVHSNPKALGQCAAYLATHLPQAELVAGSDTATCAQEVADTGDPTHVAIASSQAAALYDLDVLASSIETNPHNETRFLALERQPRLVPDASKTSLIMATPDAPSALYDAIGVWAARGINLSMLTSRVAPHQIKSPWGPYLHAQGQHEALQKNRATPPWYAHFYVDIEAGLQDDGMKDSLTELQEQQGVEVRVLGSYPHGELID